MYIQGSPNQDFLEYYLVCLACHEITSEPNLTFKNCDQTGMYDF